MLRDSYAYYSGGMTGNKQTITFDGTVDISIPGAYTDAEVKPVSGELVLLVEGKEASRQPFDFTEPTEHTTSIPWQAELPGLDMNFTEMPVADQKRQMEILHMALGMLMNAPRGDACIMMAPGDMLPDLISDTPRKDVQLFTITVRRPTATLIVDMTAYSASF